MTRDTVIVKDSSVTASLTCGSSNTQLDLVLTAYQGFARLHINEASEAGKQRFQVPHVLLPSLANRKVPWQNNAATSDSLKLSIGEADITLQYSPLQLDVSVHGIPALSFNSKQLFHFEQLRTKQVLAFVQSDLNLLSSKCMPLSATAPLSTCRGILNVMYTVRHNLSQ